MIKMRTLFFEPLIRFRYNKRDKLWTKLKKDLSAIRELQYLK